MTRHLVRLIGNVPNAAPCWSLLLALAVVVSACAGGRVTHAAGAAHSVGRPGQPNARPNPAGRSSPSPRSGASVGQAAPSAGSGPNGGPGGLTQSASGLLNMTSAPAGPGGLVRRWGSTMGGSQVVTAAQAVTDAKLVDVLVGLPGTFSQYTAQMRAANPSLKMVFYMNGTYAAGAGRDTYPESWYLHNSSGARIRSTNFNNPLMNPTNPAWVQSRVADCANSLAGLGWNGCYLDMLGPGTLTPGYLTSPPINPATGAVWTTPAWIAATTKLAITVASGVPSAMIVGNGLEDGSRYLDPASGPTVTLFKGLVAGNAQSFVRAQSDPAGQFRKESQWKSDVDMLVDAGRRGKSVLAQVKVWSGGISQAQKDAIHRYALATFMLGTDGNQRWYWSDTGSESALVEDSPYEHVNIGSPTNSYAKVSGAYQRTFSGGFVVVNPGSAAVTVALPPGRWSTLTGVAVTARLSLPANSGEILTAG